MAKIIPLGRSQEIRKGDVVIVRANDKNPDDVVIVGVGENNYDLVNDLAKKYGFRRPNNVEMHYWQTCARLILMKPVEQRPAALSFKLSDLPQWRKHLSVKQRLELLGLEKAKTPIHKMRRIK